MHIKCEDFSTVCCTIKKKGLFYLVPDAALGKGFHWLACWFINSETSLSPIRSWDSLHLTTDFPIYLVEQCDWTGAATEGSVRYTGTLKPLQLQGHLSLVSKSLECQEPTGHSFFRHWGKNAKPKTSIPWAHLPTNSGPLLHALFPSPQARSGGGCCPGTIDGSSYRPSTGFGASGRLIDLCLLTRLCTIEVNS